MRKEIKRWQQLDRLQKPPSGLKSLLQTASINEVNEKYSDEHLIGEARHRLDLVEDQLNYWDAYMLGDDGPVLRRDKRQLVSFIKKWSK